MKKLTAVLAVAAGCASGAANAFDFGVAVKASTLGYGTEAIFGISQYFNARAAYNFIDYDKDIEEDGVNYEGTLDFQTYGGYLDYHPFAGVFRISAGVFGNGNQIDLKASCPNGCDVGDVTVTSTGADPARLTGALDFDSVAPYFGLGWGNAMAGGAWHFAFDVGVLFQGEPTADLAATGTADVRDNQTGVTRPGVDIGSDPQVQSEIAEEEANLQEDVSEFDLYPVVSFTFGWRFGI